MRVGALWFRNPKMAQAARLSLRMQKELKLLLSDPPPGASFPFLSPDAAASPSSSSSLTAVDAEIEGPEGTVYAGGIFTIRIQIPERYPFQPPIVTFATPIYHPNIDTGGRICLDILNLPPKGAWQPSLNISTVITSIGLLLSEPNPDDGLMCEASREFKYNRQAFDLKARTMTEKYAKASCRMVSSCQGTQQTVELRSTGDIEVGDEIKAEDSSFVVNTSKPLGMCKKLSPDQSISHRGKDTTSKANEVTHPVLSIIESKKISEPEESIQKLKRVDEVHNVGGSSFFKKKKLSLNLVNLPKQSEIDNENRPVDQQVPSYTNPAKIQALNGGNLQTSKVSNCNLQELDTASKEKVFTAYENCKRSTGSKRLSLGFSIMCRNQDKCKNENIMPIRKLSEKPLEMSKENVPSNLVRPEFAKQARLSGGTGVTEINKKSCKAEQLLTKEEVEYLHDHKRDDCKLLLQPEEPSLSDHNSCSFLHQRGCTDGFQSSIDHGRDATPNKQQPDPSLSVIVLDSDESDQEEISRCRRTKLSLLSRRPSRGNNKECKAFVRAKSETSS